MIKPSAEELTFPFVLQSQGCRIFPEAVTYIASWCPVRVAGVHASCHLFQKLPWFQHPYGKQFCQSVGSFQKQECSMVGHTTTHSESSTPAKWTAPEDTESICNNSGAVWSFHSIRAALWHWFVSENNWEAFLSVNPLPNLADFYSMKVSVWY